METSFRLDPVRYTGRPQEEREPIEQRCYDFLDSLGVAYDRVDHDAAFHIETCHAVDEVLEAPIAKNLFLCNRQRTQFYLLLLEGDKVFKTKYLSSQLGCSRLSFAPEEDLQELLGVQPGSASLLGLLQDPENRVKLVIDKPLLSQKWLGLHPCKNTSTLRIDMKTALEQVIPALGHEPAFVELPVEEEA